MTVAVANAPVSYGVFELTVGSDRFLADPERLLDEVAGAGYSGIDLGPVGYLGTGAQLGERLAARGLGLSGGYIALPFGDANALADALPALDSLLDAFDTARRYVAGPEPRPTLAAAGSERHRAAPGQAEADRSIGLDDDGWRRFGAGLRRAVEHCRERGHEPAFHHHTATWCEAPWEIERVLELSDIGLCLDTGHLLVGGGDPLRALEEWRNRINHVHLKDARLGLLAAIRAAGGSADEIWSQEVFCPLGEGDLDIERFVAGLRSIGYDGWVVVEQDVFADDEPAFERAVADQRANRLLLSRLGV